MDKLRAVLLCCLILVSGLLQGGCWDAHELNTLSIVAGVGIDTAPDNEYDVTVQIRKVTKPTEGEPENPFTLLSGTGSTVLEGLDKIRRENNRDLFLHQNQIIVISEEQAKLGIRSLLDMFLRYHETRLEVWVVISKCRASDLLLIKLNQEPVTATALTLMMQSRSEESPLLTANMLNVTSALLNASSALVVPMVSTVDQFGEEKLNIQGSAVFLSDKMVGELNEDETLGYAIGSSDIQSGLLEVQTDTGLAVLYLSRSAAKMKVKMEDGHVSADISIDCTLSVAEINGFAGQKLPDVFGILEKAGVQRMVQLITDAFETSRALKADIFGIGRELNRSDPKAWDAIKKDWVNLYPQTTLNVTVNGNLLESGKISDSLTMRGEQ